MSFDGFLQNPTLLAENLHLMKTLKHGSLHKKLLVFAKWMSFDRFFKKCNTVHHFAENLMKIQTRSSLNEKLLVLAKSMSFDGFSQIPTLFAENLMKIEPIPAINHLVSRPKNLEFSTKLNN